MSDWRTIDTAPKDGAMLLLWEGEDAYHGHGCRFGHWKPDKRMMAGGYWSDGGRYAIHATHWMPLPDAPRRTDEES